MFFYNPIKIRLFLLFFICACFFHSGTTKAQGALKELHVASICQQGDNSENQWRIRNPNAKDIHVTYSTLGGKQVRSISAKAMDDTFFYTNATESVDIIYNDGAGSTMKVSASSESGKCVIDCPGNADRYFFNVQVTDHELVENGNQIQIPDLFCEGEVANLAFDDGSYMDLFKDGSGAHLVIGATVKSGGCEFNGKQFQFDMMFDKMDANLDLSDLGIDKDKLKDLIAALSIRTEGIKIRQSGSNYSADLTGLSSLGEFNFNATLTKEEEGFNFHLTYMFGKNEGSASFHAKIEASCPTMSVLNFTLVNAETGEDIMPVKEGDVIDLSMLPTDKLNIRANTNPEYVGSVVFDLNDKKAVQTEIVNPYSLFGNFPGGIYKQWTPDPGKYSVSATPYSKPKAKGEKGTSLTINFEFIDSGNPVADQQVVGYVLVNADTNEDLMPIKDGDKINLATLETKNLNIRANTIPENVGSVIFDLNDKKNFNTENVNPYSLAANFEGGSYKSWVPETGVYTLTATPYTMINGKGASGKLKTIKFEIDDSEEVDEPVESQQKVVSFTLINADTDEDIAILKDGDIVNLAALPNSNLKLKTNTEPQIVGSIVFDLNEHQNIKVANDSPYELEGTDIAEFISVFNIIGKHSLSATPYTEADGMGDAGDYLTISLELIYDIDNEDIIISTNESFRVSSVYPNPVEDNVSIHYRGSFDSGTTILLFDQFGKATSIESGMISRDPSILTIDISSLQLRAGIYYVKVQAPQGGKVLKIVKN
ncbi:MAG: T9SS type A sorting domain-containing protein [Bacteroidota bacterium]|nr:T9SS type A sorting domain-containing protein [Bacteroidota bacterium]